MAAVVAKAAPPARGNPRGAGGDEDAEQVVEAVVGAGVGVGLGVEVGPREVALERAGDAETPV